jgi:hypothetical protein
VPDSVDGVLAAIDSAVRDWDVSQDAMRSAPDLPRRPTVTRLEIPLDWPDGCPEPPWIDITQMVDTSPLRPYELQQGGYWLYHPGCDLYGNGRVWITTAQHRAACPPSDTGGDGDYR